MGVGWTSGEASDLVAPPLNLVLYMHLRIFAYTSNALIASFEYMELMLALMQVLRVAEDQTGAQHLQQELTLPNRGLGVSVLVSKWSQEDHNFLKTSLQAMRGAAVIDSTMTKAESRELEALLGSTPHTVLFIWSAHVLFIPSSIM